MVRVTFVMEQHVGLYTYYENLRHYIDAESEIEASWVPVTYYRPGDFWGRTRLLPAGVRASLIGRSQVRQGIARANGDAERFNLLLKEYRAAPEVTRRRLWLETVEEVMAGNPKVVDGSNGKNIIQLPVESNNGAVRNVPGVGTVVQSATTDANPNASQGSAQ